MTRSRLGDLSADQLFAALDIIDEDDAFTACQFDRHVVEAENAALTILAWPDGADFTGLSELVIAVLIRADDAGE